MSENNGNSIALGFTKRECRDLLKKTGIPRISKDSIAALNRLLTRRAREIAIKAVNLADIENREKIEKRDITRAVQMTSAFSTFDVAQEAPIVHYIWFISSGGTCLLSQSFSGLKFPDTIFAGLLTGILDLFGEVTGRRIDKFTTDDLSIHIRRIGEISVVVICDTERSEPIEELTELLAQRFDQVFTKELKQEIVDTSIFEEFIPVLGALISSAGLKIPKERLKIYKVSGALTDRQLEETVDAVALRQELRRAQEVIQELAVFRKEEEEEAVALNLNEPPDVIEIKNALQQARENIREELGSSEEEVSQEKVLAELASDFPDIKFSDSKTEPEKTVKPRKKRRKRRRKK